MQKLKANEFTYLTDCVLKVLSQNHISTTQEFLQEDAEKLSTITKLSLPQVFAVRNGIFAKYSARLVNGTSVLAKYLSEKRFISSNIPSLDAVLDGGIPTGCITEVCGLADSGKTQLCLQICINCAKNSDKTVLYVDTKGDFSATRVQKILDTSNYSHKEMAQIMFRIRIVHIWTIEELVEFMSRLKNKTIAVENLNLIIIDSLPALMLQHLGDENKVGLKLLNTFVNFSRYLCKEMGLGMICVNIQTRWVDKDVAGFEDDNDQTTFPGKEAYIEKRNRCLGKYWEHIPACVLLLDKSVPDSKGNYTEITVSVVKHNNIKCLRKCALRISNFGVGS